MSVLVVDYGMESSFTGAIKKAKSALNKRVDDYVNIENRIKSIPSNTNNCSNCAYFVKKKYQQIQEKVNTLHSLNEQVVSFIDNVKETDRHVASRIKSETKYFNKRTGIGKTNKSILASICEDIGDLFEFIAEDVAEFLETTKRNIKQWYEENKYWISIVVDVVCIVGAVAICVSTGGIALAVAIFGLVDNACDLYYDVLAYMYHRDGNEAEAERLSEKGGKDAFMWVGRQYDNLFGTDFCEGVMGAVHTGMSIFAIGYSFYKAGTNLLKDFKLDKIKNKSWLKGHGNIKWQSHFTKENFIKSFKRQIGIKKVLQKDVVKLGYKLHNTLDTNISGCMNASKTILKAYNGFKVVKGAYDNGKDYINMIGEGNFNPFTKTTDTIKEFYKDIVAISSGGVL